MSIFDQHVFPGLLQIVITIFSMLVIRRPNSAQNALATLSMVIGCGMTFFGCFLSGGDYSSPVLMSAYVMVGALLIISYVVYVREVSTPEGAYSMLKDMWWIAILVGYALMNIIFLLGMPLDEAQDFCQNVFRGKPTVLGSDHLLYHIYCRAGFIFFVHGCTTAMTILVIIYTIRKNRSYYILREYYTEDATLRKVRWDYVGNAMAILIILMLIAGPSTLMLESEGWGMVYSIIQYLMVITMTILLFGLKEQMTSFRAMLNAYNINSDADMIAATVTIPDNKEEKKLEMAYQQAIAAKYFAVPGITLPEVAMQCGVSVSYLRSYIHKKGYGSFAECVQALRMAEAQNIYRENPDISMEDLARRCGYTIIETFTRDFRKYIAQ